MTASRVRVRPPHSHWGLIAFAALCGTAVAGAMMLAEVMLLVRLITSRNLALYNAIIATIALAPTLAFIVWLPRYCQHWRFIALAGAVYAAALVLFSLVGQSLHQPWFAPISWDAEELTLSGLAAAVGASLALLALGAYRLFIFRLVEQDGTLCETCGYPAGRSPSKQCPECGAPWPPAPRRDGPATRLVARFARRPLTILITLAAILTIGFVVAHDAARPHREVGGALARQLGPPWEPAGFTHSPALPRGTTSVYRMIEDEASQENLALVMDIAHVPAWRGRRVHLRLAEPGMEVRPGWRFLGPMRPNLYIDVPRSEIRNVMRSGPPEEAAQLLLDAARETYVIFERNPLARDIESIKISWPDRTAR